VVSHVESFSPKHLPQLQALINCHLNAAVPGWSLPDAFIASRLERQPEEYVVDPWVVERATLCAVERDRVVAAAQLLRYGDDAKVGDAYRAVGEIAWLVAWPPDEQASAELLGRPRRSLRHGRSGRSGRPGGCRCRCSAACRTPGRISRPSWPKRAFARLPSAPRPSMVASWSACRHRRRPRLPEWSSIGSSGDHGAVRCRP
jgi:hypothetical protein